MYTGKIHLFLLAISKFLYPRLKLFLQRLAPYFYKKKIYFSQLPYFRYEIFEFFKSRTAAGKEGSTRNTDHIQVDFSTFLAFFSFLQHEIFFQSKDETKIYFGYKSNLAKFNDFLTQKDGGLASLLHIFLMTKGICKIFKMAACTNNFFQKVNISLKSRKINI